MKTVLCAMFVLGIGLAATTGPVMADELITITGPDGKPLYCWLDPKTGRTWGCSK